MAKHGQCNVGERGALRDLAQNQRHVPGHPQPVSRRKPVVRHANAASVGTDFTNPVAPKSGSQQAAEYYARAANRAGRPPLV